MTKRTIVGLEPLLLVKEVAGPCRISDKTILRAIKKGELEAIRIGRGYRITPGAVRRYLKQRATRKI
jgi:excisionase family DNA binding protein